MKIETLLAPVFAKLDVRTRIELSRALGAVLQAPLPEPVADDQLAVERSRLASQRAELRGRLRAAGG